jgi:hypothetical protein
MATNNEIAIRSSMNNLIQREKESNLFKKKLQDILKIPMSAQMRDNYSKNGIHLINGTLSDAISASLVMQAMAGNIQAYAMIRDTMGYKPIEQVKQDVVVRIDMSPRARELGE